MIDLITLPRIIICISVVGVYLVNHCRNRLTIGRSIVSKFAGGAGWSLGLATVSHTLGFFAEVMSCLSSHVTVKRKPVHQRVGAAGGSKPVGSRIRAI